ncbi:merozoite surface protein 2-like [Ostrinia nubilalis]|uniref:merozoite surface protein 2-like n=1 Tax=Ostrinia nubilalis TaxID=29057 RepID=UPI0030823FBB
MFGAVSADASRSSAVSAGASDSSVVGAGAPGSIAVSASASGSSAFSASASGSSAFSARDSGSIAVSASASGSSAVSASASGSSAVSAPASGSSSAVSARASGSSSAVSAPASGSSSAASASSGKGSRSARRVAHQRVRGQAVQPGGSARHERRQRGERCVVRGAVGAAGVQQVPRVQQERAGGAGARVVEQQGARVVREWWWRWQSGPSKVHSGSQYEASSVPWVEKTFEGEGIAGRPNC